MIFPRKIYLPYRSIILLFAIYPFTVCPFFIIMLAMKVVVLVGINMIYFQECITYCYNDKCMHGRRKKYPGNGGGGGRPRSGGYLSSPVWGGLTHIFGNFGLTHKIILVICNVHLNKEIEFYKGDFLWTSIVFQKS